MLRKTSPATKYDHQVEVETWYRTSKVSCKCCDISWIRVKLAAGAISGDDDVDRGRGGCVARRGDPNNKNSQSETS
ncbi:hypothetical protein LSTR_LSTR013828 [Laodelphax striatellus]|uniref:Uncharacterized protein n=1 Tax=Laodelphax striatellus TaxID=195883 RepID=A0A482XSU7_LAOST|nr:hypothetical protein LSTR_LSTR013828 [Laodelphax striatellus]